MSLCLVKLILPRNLRMMQKTVSFFSVCEVLDGSGSCLNLMRSDMLSLFEWLAFLFFQFLYTISSLFQVHQFPHAAGHQCPNHHDRARHRHCSVPLVLATSAFVEVQKKKPLKDTGLKAAFPNAWMCKEDYFNGRVKHCCSFFDCLRRSYSSNSRDRKNDFWRRAWSQNVEKLDQLSDVADGKKLKSFNL